MKKVFIPFIFFSLFVSSHKSIFTASEIKQHDPVIITVNGRNIKKAELDSRLKKFSDMDPLTFEALKQEIIDQLINNILLEQFIDKQGLIVPRAEVEREVDKIRKKVEEDQKRDFHSLEQLLELIGSDINEFKDGIRHSLALNKYFKTVLSEKKLRQYFEKNKNLFNGESIRISHIFIDTRGMKTREELHHALNRIMDIRRAVDSGGDFGELAKKYSDCPSASNGGDLGYIQRKENDIEKSLSDTAFALNVGEVSEPVHTGLGYHIIKVTDRKEGLDVHFSDVIENVRMEVLEMETVKLLHRLRSEARIEFNW